MDSPCDGKMRCQLYGYGYGLTPLLVLLLLATATGTGCCTDAAGTCDRFENFSTDPGWQGRGNRRVAGRVNVIQDFGYSPTNHAGLSRGEIGGRLSRSTTPAHYALEVDPVGLDQVLTASGSIALLDDRDGGTFIGWFNASRQGWRPVNFVGFRLDGPDLHLAYTTGTWKAGGTGTGRSLEPGKSYRWELLYDPMASDGLGALTFTIGGENNTLELMPGHREEGALMDRFGIFNLQEPGGCQEVYLDDLSVMGSVHDLDTDPGWDCRGNRASFTDDELRGSQDFGYSSSDHAGGEMGELGGLIWRIESQAFYGDDVGVLTLDDAISASGRISVVQASSDSGLLFGWFNEADRGWPPRNFLGIVVEGPSRVGHYFRLKYVGEHGDTGESEGNPFIFPDGAGHLWQVSYDPTNRTFSANLDGDFIFTRVPQWLNATFNRFGMLNLQEGGHQMEAYLDDISYTSREIDEVIRVSQLLAAVVIVTSRGRYIYRGIKPKKEPCVPAW